MGFAVCAASTWSARHPAVKFASKARLSCSLNRAARYTTLRHLSDGRFGSQGAHCYAVFIVADANVRITAFKVAPNGDGLIEVLSAACLVFLWAADPFAVSAQRPDVTAQIEEQVQRFATLPGAFPGEKPVAA
jgi:hypothetical protein